MIETFLVRRLTTGSEELSSQGIATQDTLLPPPGESVFDGVIQDDGVWGVLGGCQYLSESSARASDVPRVCPRQ